MRNLRHILICIIIFTVAILGCSIIISGGNVSIKNDDKIELRL